MATDGEKSRSSSREIVYKSKPLKGMGDLREAYRQATSAKKGKILYDDVNVGDFFSAGQKEMIITNKDNDDVDRKEKLWSAIDSDTEIRIEYCSIYDDCVAACLVADAKTCASQKLPRP